MSGGSYDKGSRTTSPQPVDLVAIHEAAVRSFMTKLTAAQMGVELSPLMRQNSWEGLWRMSRPMFHELTELWPNWTPLKRRAVVAECFTDLQAEFILSSSDSD